MNYIKGVINEHKKIFNDKNINYDQFISDINKLFDENYKKSILRFIGQYDNIFPIVHPEFRSLSKLWNNCLINSTNDLVLLLNDDITISDELFFTNLEKIISKQQNSFKINGSWSHTLLNRRQVNQVGWFDERFLGVGEEDGDFEWRWGNKYKSNFISYNLPHIINHVEHKNCLENIKIINNKYSLFNHNFSQHKYKESENGINYGIMNKKLICVDETPNFYQTEEFFWDNKDSL